MLHLLAVGSCVPHPFEPSYVLGSEVGVGSIALVDPKKYHRPLVCSLKQRRWPLAPKLQRECWVDDHQGEGPLGDVPP